MTAPFDRALQSRVEDAGINASAPREQLWLDGWLVRRCPGKAKRARCIQAVATGRDSVEAKLVRCLALYDEAGLQPYVRITPFSLPAGIDDSLAALGLARVDDTRVMIAPLPLATADVAAPPSVKLRFHDVDADRYAGWVGAERGSPPSEQMAHAARVRDSPVPYRAVLAADAAGRVVAGGQIAVEQDMAGLYDVFTVPESRGRGHADALCRYLLSCVGPGVSWAYLQVDAGNVAARRVYARMGFADAYAYHYRTPPPT